MLNAKRDVNTACNRPKWALSSVSNCVIVQTSVPWHSRYPCYCSGSRRYSFQLLIRQRREIFSLIRRSINTKLEYTHHGKWEHQHLFYKPDQMPNILLTRSPKQNIFLCSKWIRCSLAEQYLPIFVLKRKMKILKKFCSVQNNLPPFTLSTFFCLPPKQKFHNLQNANTQPFARRNTLSLFFLRPWKTDDLYFWCLT